MALAHGHDQILLAHAEDRAVVQLPDRSASYPELMHRWFDAASRLGLPRGQSFDLDFHTESPSMARMP